MTLLTEILSTEASGFLKIIFLSQITQCYETEESSIQHLIETTKTYIRALDKRVYLVIIRDNVC